MSLIAFILIVYGISNILVEEDIFRKPIMWFRNQHPFLNKLLSCTTCLSFWIGMLLYLVFPIQLSGIFILDILLSGFLSSGATNLIEHIKIKIGI